MAKRKIARTAKRPPADAFAWETVKTYRDGNTLKVRAGFKGLQWLSTVRVAEHDGRAAVEPNEQAAAAREALNARSLVEHGTPPEQAALAAAHNEALAARYEVAALANHVATQWPDVRCGRKVKKGAHDGHVAVYGDAAKQARQDEELRAAYRAVRPSKQFKADALRAVARRCKVNTRTVRRAFGRAKLPIP